MTPTVWSFFPSWAAVVERFEWRLYAYCLMDNHYLLMVATLHLKHGYTQAQIAAHLGLHYAAVSRIVNRSMQETRPDPSDMTPKLTGITQSSTTVAFTHDKTPGTCLSVCYVLRRTRLSFQSFA